MALFTALIAPYFIDWTAYKRDFEQQASRIIGQSVSVGGDATVRLLPQPSVAFTQLSVGNDLANKPMMTVERFSANVELMPFLSGEIRIVDMALESPVFNIQIDDGGKVNWTNRQGALLNPDQVKLDQLTVTNASFNIEGVATNHVIKGEQINADVSAQSLYGPWQISGKGVLDEVETAFQFSTGRLSDENSIRLKADVRQAGRPYRLQVDGPVKVADSILSWVGAFSIAPDSKATSPFDLASEPLPVKVDGLFSLLPTRLELSEYRIDIGPKEDPFTLTGLGSARLKGGIDFKLQIDGRQIDLDRISQMKNAQSKTSATLETRIQLINEVLTQIPVPTFKGEIDLEIPAIIAGDTFIRQVSALVRPFGKGWEIVRLKSSLPGNTLVEASGRVGSGDDFGFHGNILIASRQPSGFSAWAAGKVDPSIRRLKSAGLSANVTLSPTQIILDGMELLLDNNRLTGNIKRLAPVVTNKNEKGKAAIVADLSGDVIRLEDLRAIGSIFLGGDSVDRGNDFDVTVKADELHAFDLKAGGVDLQFQYDNGELSVARLNLRQLFGAAIESKGQITNLLQQPSGNISLSLAAPSLQPMLSELKTRFGSAGIFDALTTQSELTSDTKFKLEIDSKPSGDDAGAKSRNRIILTGVAAETNVKLSGLFDGGFGDTSSLWADMSAELTNPNSGVLLEQIGLQSLGFNPAFGGLDQPLAISVESVGSLEDGYSTLLSANSDLFSMSGQGVLKPYDGQEGSYEFDVTTGTKNLAPLVTAFGYSLPYLNPLLGDVAPFSGVGKVSKDGDGAMQISIGQAQIYNNKFDGDLEITTGLLDKKELGGALNFDLISADVLSGLMTGQGFVDELGALNENKFILESVLPNPAKLKITADTADIGIGDLAKNLGFDLAIKNGNFAMDDLAFKWNDALVSGRLALANTKGTGAMDGQLFFENLTLPSVTNALEAPNFMEGRAQGSLTLNASGKSMKALLQSATGNGVMFVGDGSLNGIRNEGLELVLEAADRESFEINTASVEPLARQAFLKDTYSFDETSAPFTISRGQVQFRNIALKGASPSAPKPLTGNLAFDLYQDRFEAEVSVEPDPGKEKVSGASPDVTFRWQGSTDDLTLETDVRALEGYLSIRAFEREQARVETLQAAILERQRFRYELLRSNERTRWIEARKAELERARLEEEARIENERLAKIEAERLAKEETERIEAEKRAIAEAKRLVKLEEERLAAERVAAEALAVKQAEEAAARAAEIKKRNEAIKSAEAEEAAANVIDAQKSDDTAKSGFEIKKLPEPEPKSDIFQNIEKLLFN